MWRFVLVSFVALGWAFYVLSGGSDYAPVENSIQVQSKIERPEPEPDESRQASLNRQLRTLAQVEAMMESMEETEAETEELSVTLAATRTDGPGIIEAEASRPKAELLQMNIDDRNFETQESIDTAVAAALGDPSFDPSQLRWVKEGMVDLRSGPGLSFDRVAQVTKGTEVAVLEDPGHGWLNVRIVDSYETGWLAEWLVTEPE
ncbi:MAG: SH3 domain-containing protein [Roseovarius sp.]